MGLDRKFRDLPGGQSNHPLRHQIVDELSPSRENPSFLIREHGGYRFAFQPSYELTKTTNGGLSSAQSWFRWMPGSSPAEERGRASRSSAYLIIRGRNGLRGSSDEGMQLSR